MFKSLDKYILKEVASPFAIGLLVYSFTMVVHNIFLLSDMLISKRVSFTTFFLVLVYLLPFVLTVTIPIATLMGIMAGLSRMNTDSEIIAFKTVGINHFRLLKPIIYFAFLSFLFCTALVTYIAPESNYRLYRVLQQIQFSTTISEIRPQTFFKGLYPYVIYFNRLDFQTNEWHDIFIFSQKFSPKDTIITARKGKFLHDMDKSQNAIVMDDATIYQFDRNKLEEDVEVFFYTQYKEEIASYQPTSQTRKTGQILFHNLIQDIKQNPQNRLLLIELHRRLSIPFACLALALVGLSMGMYTKKGGNINGFIISIGIAFIYYTIEMILENLTRKEFISPFWGMWMPNFFLVAVGLLLFYLSFHEKSIDWGKFLFFFNSMKMGWGQKEKKIRLAKKTTHRLIPIMDMYVSRKLLSIFLLIFISLIIIYGIISLIEQLDELVENNSPFHYALKYVIYNTPEMISFLLPVSLLTAVLLTFSIMSKKNEITAVQVSGISLIRLSIPAIIIGIILSIGAFFIQEYITPEANKKAQYFQNLIYRSESGEDFNVNNNWAVRGKNEFYFSTYDPNQKNYINFNIYELNDDFKANKIITSSKAFWDQKNPSLLTMENVSQTDFESDKPVNIQTFGLKRTFIPEGKSLFRQNVKQSKYLNIKELKAYIHYLDTNRINSQRYRAQLQQKYAQPFISIIMVLIAFPFSLLMGKKGAIYGIGVAVGISMVFWFVLAYFNSLGGMAFLSPFISAFGPLFLFAIMALILFKNIKT